MTAPSRFPQQPLVGPIASLEPLEAHHLAGLARAIADGQLWQLFYTFVPHPDHLEPFIQQAMDEADAGLGQTYAIVSPSGQVLGSTRYRCTNWAHLRTEIGFTFLAASAQGGPVNTQCKWLLLQQAFEELGFNRVELLTDFYNHRSRAAMLRLGAKEEGLLRTHMVRPDGRVRDSMIYSITRHDWPGVSAHLQHRLRQRSPLQGP